MKRVTNKSLRFFLSALFHEFLNYKAVKSYSLFRNDETVDKHITFFYSS